MKINKSSKNKKYSIIKRIKGPENKNIAKLK